MSTVLQRRVPARKTVERESDATRRPEAEVAPAPSPIGDLSHVPRDMRRIALLGAGMFAVLAVLTIVLG